MLLIPRLLAHNHIHSENGILGLIAVYLFLISLKEEEEEKEIKLFLLLCYVSSMKKNETTQWVKRNLFVLHTNSTNSSIMPIS